MDLRHYLRVLRKHLILIVAATLLCIAGAMVTTIGTTPVYEGTAKLLVVAETDPAGGVSSALQGTMLSQQLIESFAKILESRATANAGSLSRVVNPQGRWGLPGGAAAHRAASP